MKILISARAGQEVDNATAYYHSIHPALADRLLDEFSAILSHLRAHPKIYHKVTRHHHIASLHSFPYEIYYRIKGETVQIVAFIPGRINPTSKMKRLRRG